MLRCENSVFEQVFEVFQAGMIDKLGDKTSKRNQEGFAFYVDFVFV